MSRMSRNHYLLVIYFGLVVFFLLSSLLVVIPISFIDAQFLRFPPEAYSLRWYRRFFSDTDFVDATILSITVGLMATAIATTFGTLAAVVLTRKRFLGRKVVFGLMLAPMIVPVIIFALGLYVFLAQLNLLGNIYALVFAHANLALPFSVLIVSAALENFDITLERAARVMGASPARAFFHVTLPSI